MLRFAEAAGKPWLLEAAVSGDYGDAVIALSGLTTAQAVRRASLDILEARRKAKVTTHPFYWGAFIASGDWR